MKRVCLLVGLAAGCQTLPVTSAGRISVHLSSAFRAQGAAKTLADVDHIRVELRAADSGELRAATQMGPQQGSEVHFDHVPNGTYFAMAEAFESSDDSLSITQGGPQRSLNDVQVASPSVTYTASNRLEIQLRLLDGEGGGVVNVQTSGLQPSVSYHTWLLRAGQLLAPDVRAGASFQYQGLPPGTYQAVGSIWPTASHSTPSRPSQQSLTFPLGTGLPVPTFHITIPGIIDTVADGGSVSGDLLDPMAVVADDSGNLYVADSGHHRVRLRTASGTFVTVAGTGFAGFAGDGGGAAQAQLKGPEGLALGLEGELYVADTGNHRIRKIVNGVITTVAGTGSAGFSGDGGPATAAQLSAPSGLAIAANGDLLIADTGNNRIRRISNGLIVTAAGTGHQSVLKNPKGVDVLADGRLLIADTGSNVIKRLTDGVLEVIAGAGNAGFSGDGGPALLAKLSNPTSVKTGPFGDILIVDAGNQRIRRLEGTVITSVAGAGGAGFSGDGGPAYLARLKGPSAVWVDRNGVVYIADTKNDRIRKLD